MKVISAKLNSLTVDEIKDLQAGNSIKFDFGEVGADSLMLNRIVADGMAVEANQHFTVALDLKITDELRRACVARELVNRIQNRRKDQNFAISDRISIELYSESEVLKQAVKENESYIKGETQADAIVWKDSAAGLQDTDADGEKVFVEAMKVKNLYLRWVEDIQDAFAVSNTGALYDALERAKKSEWIIHIDGKIVSASEFAEILNKLEQN